VLTTPFTRYNHARVSRFTCSRCGVFDVFERNVSSVTGLVTRLSHDRAWVRPLLSYWIRKTPATEEDRPLIEGHLIEQIVREQRLPGAEEQANNLIRYIGEHLESQQDPGGNIPFAADKLISIVGCVIYRGVWYIADQLDKEGLLLFPRFASVNEAAGSQAPDLPPSARSSSIQSVRLTFAGWKRFAELQRSHSEGPIAFMAMPFNNTLLDRVYAECFKPAVSKTGFDLRRIIDNPPAGPIDDRLRVEIRKSRFTICELTDKNPGAYWEGGFAEGLGRPVIYTCNKTFFDTKGTHFDTNHCHTVLWTEEALSDAGERLKATIRATLPGEAKLTD
jgi:hypothetical protein